MFADAAAPHRRNQLAVCTAAVTMDPSEQPPRAGWRNWQTHVTIFPKTTLNSKWPEHQRMATFLQWHRRI
jgi:hypothetical protein